MSKIKLSKDFIRNTVKRALNEDLFPSGDITSSLLEDKKIIQIAKNSLIRERIKEFEISKLDNINY